MILFKLNFVKYYFFQFFKITIFYQFKKMYKYEKNTYTTGHVIIISSNSPPHSIRSVMITDRSK